MPGFMPSPYTLLKCCGVRKNAIPSDESVSCTSCGTNGNWMSCVGSVTMAFANVTMKSESPAMPMVFVVVVDPARVLKSVPYTK